MNPIMSKRDAATLVDSARIRQGRTWSELAEHLGAPLVWATAALLGQHPMTAQQARAVCELLGLGEDVLLHRIRASYEALAEGRDTDVILEEMLGELGRA